MQKIDDRINRMDILLLLLSAEGPTGRINEPIEGKTRLQKELFLSQKKMETHSISRPYSFRPYHYGPYCKDIYNDIEWLKEKGIIEESSAHSPFGEIVRSFRLTNLGIQETQKMIDKRNLNEQYNIVKEVKRKFNSMSVVKLVEFTHREYADYVGHEHKY